MSISGNFLKATAVSVIGIACTAAHADSPSSVGFQRSSLVHYSDLDLNRQQDVAKLYTRITAAADQLCGPRSLTGIHYKWTDYARCYNATVAQTVAKVDRPTLSAYFQQHSLESVSGETSIAEN
jgi:UrcA family protein